MLITHLTSIHPVLSRPGRVKASRSRRLPALVTRWMSGKRLDVFMSLAYFAIGFSPITPLAIAIIGFLLLYIAALILVLPSVVLGISLTCMFPYYGKLALKALVIGLIAAFLNDCTPIPFTITSSSSTFLPTL